MSKLKTITLTSDGESPSLIVCKGHVNVETFDEASKNEGWSGGGDTTKDCIKHVYGCFVDDKFIHGEMAYCYETEPYTIAYWD